jgi:hypothetical protein
MWTDRGCLLDTGRMLESHWQSNLVKYLNLAPLDVSIDHRIQGWEAQLPLLELR